MLTIRPHFCSLMYFWTALVIRNGPRRLTAITESHCSSVILNSMASRVIPALLTSTVGAPSDRGGHLIGLADIGAYRERLPSGVLDLLHRGRAVGLVQVEDGHGHSVGGQPDGRPGADAAGCPGHYRDSL